MQNNTQHYGITGGIGSGKSMVCRLFSIVGVPIFNADAEAKKLYLTDTELAEWVIQYFGNEVYEHGQFQPKILASK
ncbi:MAG: dephospho-CoA kinase, partial [Chitinophagaceae bacterium]|nr:dephospho-CoA kinase [Chitinophagaceae bacterium]